MIRDRAGALHVSAQQHLAATTLKPAQVDTGADKLDRLVAQRSDLARRNEHPGVAR